jgi:hypothetical protein
MNIKFFMIETWMKIMSFFVEKPTKKLCWTTQDYECG